MSGPTRPIVTGEVLSTHPADPFAAPAGGTEASGRPNPPSVWTRLPLRTRLLGILVVALFVALAATGYGVQLILRGYLVRQIDDQLHSQYNRASANGDYLGRLLSPTGGTDADGDTPVPTRYSFYLFIDGSATGSPLPGQSDTDPPQFVVVSSTTATRLDGRTFTLGSGHGRGQWRAVAIPVRLNGSEGSVTLALPVGDVDRAVAQLRLLMLIIGALAAAACTVLGWFAIRRAFAPLEEVETTAAAIAEGDLSRRVPDYPPSTEVGRLTTSLNGMLSQIEVAFRAREASEARTRRFAADASHELRTPLAAIRGFAELYRQGAVRDPDDVARTMRRIEDEAARMGVLVEDLLLLARLDEQRPGRSEPVDLTVLAGDAVHDARGLDATRRVTLTGLEPGRGPQTAVVIGDDARLRQVVANLVGNAVRHTPAGTPVEVAVGLSSSGPGQRAVLEVRDHGPGIAPEAADKVFERFYRIDASRQRGKGGGSGLGLSIVAAVVAAHGGEVGVAQTPSGGATFRVSLPPAPAPAHVPVPAAG